MRILHIYKDYHPVRGGIENHVRVLAEAQAAAGHDVVANDSAKCYFDLPQFPRGADQFQYFWWGTSPAVDSVYSFNPAEGVEEKDLPRILGGQGNNWSEYTADAYTLEWKCWPRACACRRSWRLPERWSSAWPTTRPSRRS